LSRLILVQMREQRTKYGILWKEKTSMKKDELFQQMHKLQQGKMSSREMYHTIHEFGREDFLQARPVVERFLTHDDAQLRYIALEVLTNHWRLAEHWQTARDFLEHDPDDDCRRMGASSLEALKMNTKDRPTLEVLARVVCNEQEDGMVRVSAYTAMHGVIHFNPREHFKMTCKWTSLLREIDWDMVKSYLPEGSDLVTDSLIEINRMQAEEGDAVQETINRFLDEQAQESGVQCSPTDLTENSDQFADSQMQGENFVSETTKKKPIPPDLLAQLRSHQQWCQTLGKEGKQLEAEGLDLSAMDLFEQNLAEADLHKTRFDHADLRKADLAAAYLGASSFHQAHLDEAMLVKAELTRATLTRASLRSIRGQRADFMRADLRGADLRGASFIQANLSQAIFQNAVLTRANFDKANLTGADLTGAHLNGIFLSGVAGIESVKADWIEVGTDEAPKRLEGEAARQWLLETAATSPPL
jgi:uncharacterized protein YjbI with pentapeptide repeats